MLSVLLGAGTGWSYWTATATGQGRAGTGALTAPVGVAAAVKAGAAGTVVVTWTPSAVNGGAPAQGYYVIRIAEGTGATSPACGTSVSVPVPSLTCQDQPQPDGDYRYRVTAIHHTWTAESGSSPLVTVDTTAPVAPSAPDLVGASDSGTSETDGVTNDSAPTFSGTAEAGSTVRLYSGATSIGSAVATGGTYSITAASALSEGEHSVTARAIDSADNVSVASEGTGVTIDTIAPHVTVARHAGQPSPTRNQPIHFTVTFSEPVTGFTAPDVSLSAPAGATVAVTGSAAAYAVEVSGMTADGTVTVAVGADVAVDTAGNRNTVAPADSSVTRDTTAPATPGAPTLDVASDTGSSSADRLTNDATPLFSGIAEPGSTVTLREGATALGSVVAGLAGTWSLTSTTLVEGANTVTVTATDAAGNTSAASGGTTVTIDVTAPAAPSVPDMDTASDSGSSTTDNYTNDTTPTFSGIADTGTTVTLYGADAVGTSAVTSGTYQVTIGVLTEGVHPVTAIATDTAGNVSTASPGLVMSMDATAPTVVITAVTYSNARVTSTGTAGSATGDPAAVGVVICQQNSWPCTAGNTDESGPANVSPTDGAWTHTSRNLESCILLICSGPGQIHLRATQTDQAGNTGISNVVSRNYS